jgi:hypothetical protein
MFIGLQGMKYVKAHFTISDGVYDFITLIIVKGKERGCTGFCSSLPPPPIPTKK